MAFNKKLYIPKVKVNGNFVPAYLMMSSIYGLETELESIKNHSKIYYSMDELPTITATTDMADLIKNKMKNHGVLIINSPSSNFRPEGSSSTGILEIFKSSKNYAVARYTQFSSPKTTMWEGIFYSTWKGWDKVEQVINKTTSINANSTNDQYPSAKCVYTNLQDKQDVLVSGTNIKTINNESLLGSGNITISSGGTATTVKVDGASITSNNEADILTMNGNYNASTNKLATASDVGGKQDTIDASHKLSADLVDDTSTTNKFVTASDKTNWNGKQDASNNSGLNTTDKSIVGAINEVDAVAKGANKAEGFASYSALITELNSASATAYKVGQSFFVQTLNVPDLWILSVESSSSTYTYTTDAAFITATGASGGQQVGYYKLAQLETQKVDLSNYVPTSRTIAGVDLIDNVTKSELLTALNVADGAEQNTVDSVNGATGSVVLDADDISDTNTTNKFVTSTEKSTWNGKQNAIDSSHKLSADVVDDSSSTNKFVTASDKTTWNSKQAGNSKLTSISGLSNSSTGLVKLTNGVASLDNTAYTTNTGTVTSVRVQAGTGLSSSTSTAQSTSLNTTISIASGYKLPTTTEFNALQTLSITKSANGCATLSGGLKVAWGTVTAGQPFSVTFAGSLSFSSSTSYQVVICPLYNSNTGSGGFWVKTKSTTGFTGSATAGFGTIQYIAIGY